MASQRGRVLEAVVKAVAEKGYAATTIGDVVARAGVSRRTFYEQFGDKEECFLAAFDTGFEFVSARIEEEFAALGPGDWQGRVRILFETYLATLASEPEFTKVLHVDALAAGERVRARWGETLERLVALCRSLHEMARAQQPDVPEVSDEVLWLLAGSIPEVVREYVRTGRVGRLPALAPQLVSLALAIISGAVVARAKHARPHPRRRHAGERASVGR